MFLKHGCPLRQQSQNMAKISKSYILTPPHPWGHVMSVKCEEPIDEPKVQVWLPYHHQNFKYCTLFVSGTELPDSQRPDIAPVGRLFHCDVTIKWPVKWMRYCDVTIELRQKEHMESHMSWIRRKANYGQTDGWMDGPTDGRSDDPITRCPRRTFQARGIIKTAACGTNVIRLLQITFFEQC